MTDGDHDHEPCGCAPEDPRGQELSLHLRFPQDPAPTITSHPISSKRAKRKRSENARAGVVYMARVPPGLDVGIVRSLLGRCGPLGRVWLRAETSETVAARRRLGGRHRAGFTDGWVEFQRQGDAESAVALLNGQPIRGATRRGKFQNDLWCLRLLPAFSWDDLVDEVFGTRRERVLRVKSEVAAARRERAFIEKRADLARIVLRDRRASAADADAVGTTLGATVDDGIVELRNFPRCGGGTSSRELVRHFHQKRSLDDDNDYEGGEEQRALRALERADEDDDDTALREKQSRDAKAIDMELVAKLFKRRRSGEA
jgi:ESF2/ABP1 family protein